MGGLWSSLLAHPLLSLSVEPPKGSLSVEHLKVLMVEHLKVMAALTVEHAYASLSVEPLKGPLLNSRADGGLNSRAFVPHPIRSRERECIYYICYYAMNDRSISSPQFKRLVLPSLSGYRLVLRRSRRTKANGKAGPKLRGWVERSANC